MAPIFSRASGFLRGFDLTLQLQVGCPGGCLFCYVPSNPWFTSPRTRGQNGRLWGYRMFEKKNFEPQLAEALASGALADKTVYWSGVTDPYAARPTVTRRLWEILTAADAALRPRRLVIQTRFRPDRDLEHISKYAAVTPTSDAGPPVVFSFSIGTDRDDLIRAWEKSTPSYEQRMACIAALRKAGLTVIPTLSPFALWDNLESTLARFADLGVPYLTVLFFKNLPPASRSATTPPLFLRHLRDHHAELLDSAWQRDQLARLRAAFAPRPVLDGQPGFDTLTHPHTIDLNP